MDLDGLEIGGKSRLAALLEHFGRIKDPRKPRRVALPLPEVLLLVVCGSVADCDDYDAIAAWGKPISTSCAVFFPITMACPAGAG